MKQVIIIIASSLLLHSCNSGKPGPDLFSGSSDYGIAYNVALKDSSGNTNYEVFAMRSDGSGVKNISNSNDVAWTYRSHRDDLYFISDRDTTYRCFFLYKSDYQGGNIQKISKLRLEDSWMDFRNDGNEAVVSGRIGKETRYQLFLINTETGSYNQLTNDTSAFFTDPAFSPDGKQIAFVYRRKKPEKSQNEEVYIMNSDGSGLRQLTYYPQDNISRDSSGYKAGAPHWHPTQDFISYISMQDGKHSIFAVTPDGKKQWKLTDNNFSEGWHDWSPDGKWLTFDMKSENSDQYHIVLMNWETKEFKKLTGSKYRSQLSPNFIRLN